ncbi:hypothetical protein F5148DRAFT_1341805 [Russula earlei]|uniref:Uncharacterized protein n=1 Tax=Russula earlei TaxID=71964 RepID=A0ACC0UE84_9AGAM|nr:hypothetical protein F5148DRAFT_1341805 [Russula earlei]
MSAVNQYPQINDSTASRNPPYTGRLYLLCHAIVTQPSSIAVSGPSMENVDGLPSSALVAMDKIHLHSCAPVSVAVVYVGDSVLKSPPAAWIGCQSLGGEHPQVHQWIEPSSMMRVAGIQSAQAGPCAAYIRLAVFVDDADHSDIILRQASMFRRRVVREKRVLNLQDNVCAAKMRLVYHGHESKSKREQKKNTSGTQKVVVCVDDEGVGVSSAHMWDRETRQKQTILNAVQGQRGWWRQERPFDRFGLARASWRTKSVNEEKNDDGGGVCGRGRGGKESKCLVFDLVPLMSSLYILGKLWDVENTMIDVKMGYYTQTMQAHAVKHDEEYIEYIKTELGCVTEDNTEEVHLINVIIHVITSQRSIKLEGDVRGEEGRNRLRHHRECVQGAWGSGGLDGQCTMKGGLRPGKTVEAQSKAMEEDTVKENARRERKTSAKDGC